jgi:hypothetical protein
MRWPAPSDQTPSKMAKTLSKDKQLGQLGYKSVALKKILEGSYPPMIIRGIESPYRR